VTSPEEDVATASESPGTDCVRRLVGRSIRMNADSAEIEFRCSPTLGCGRARHEAHSRVIRFALAIARMDAYVVEGVTQAVPRKTNRFSV